MSVILTTLPSGLRVVTHRMPHVETVALNLYVASGARHEAPAEHGISHLLEHMAFKGTRRRDARAIAEEIEQVGGELNAATSLETTAYYARVLKGDEAVALDIIADIIQHSRFTPGELTREREVILQEIAATHDSPDEIVFDLSHEACFPGQAIGRPILGTTESVSSFSPKDLRGFLKRRYRAGDMVLAAAGAVDHGRILRLAEAQFGGLHDGRADGAEPARWGGGIRVADRAFEQSHLVLSFEGPGYGAADFTTGQVFSSLFGGGMSSRLFQEVRERRGLCYAIYSFAWGLRDAGVFGIHAATSAEMMTELFEVVTTELKRAADSRPKPAEIARAKAQFKVGLLAALESSGARAEQLARQLLAYGRVLDTSEIVEKVERVGADDIRAFAAAMLERGRPSVAMVGAKARSKRIERLAEGLAPA